MEANPGRFIPEKYRGKHDHGVVKINLNRPMKEILADLSKHPVTTQLSLTGTIIVGRDIAHAKFKDKQNFPFELLSDAEEKVCRLFDVIKEKNMYGKKVMGIERSTFLIDAAGVLRAEWRKVKVPGHVDAVLAAVKSLDKT